MKSLIVGWIFSINKTVNEPLRNYKCLHLKQFKSGLPFKELNSKQTKIFDALVLRNYLLWCQAQRIWSCPLLLLPKKNPVFGILGLEFPIISGIFVKTFEPFQQIILRPNFQLDWVLAPRSRNFRGKFYRRGTIKLAGPLHVDLFLARNFFGKFSLLPSTTFFAEPVQVWRKTVSNVGHQVNLKQGSTDPHFRETHSDTDSGFLVPEMMPLFSPIEQKKRYRNEIETNVSSQIFFLFNWNDSSRKNGCFRSPRNRNCVKRSWVGNSVLGCCFVRHC